MKETKIAKKEITLKGIPTSPGIAIGKTFFINRKISSAEKKPIGSETIASEIARFNLAVEATHINTQKTRDKATKDLGEIVGRIFDAHLMILEDEILLDEIREKIRTEQVNADYALFTVMSKSYHSMMAQQKDYFRERAEDIRDVGLRILSHLCGRADKFDFQAGEPVIIAARMIAPSEIVHLDRNYILGVMTEGGGGASHTAILTRALEVPAVVGLKNLSDFAESVEIAMVNGNSGKVILNPTTNTQTEYRKKQERYQQFFVKLSNLKDLPAETTDGKRIKLLANIELPNEVISARNQGAEGIGLFRTEYLYLTNNQFPSEEEQFKAYRNIAEAMSPHPVTIRTFDLGGDKTPEEMEIGRESNPFLGWRAIRISLSRPEIFKAQIRAVLRASQYGKIRLMFPLITGMDEIRRVKLIVTEVKKELSSNNTPFDRNLEIGIMVEVPSAVMMASDIAREVDFFSIGTNDLIQFTLAADRGNELVASLFQDLHPAILRMIKMTVEAGHTQKIDIGMCGELAGNPLATVMLIGLGLDSLSVTPLALLEIKKIIRSISFSEAEEFAREVLTLKTYKDIKKRSEAMMKERFADMPIWFGNHLS
jgi:phosphotransferase system enzyme I (PtsI)